MISYNEALRLTLEHIRALDPEDVPLISALDRVAARDLTGQVDSPSVDASLKDGFAIQSADIASASEDKPVSLNLVGEVAAGGSWAGHVGPGEAVRILSGAPLPDGADAIIAEEFTHISGGRLWVTNDAYPGRNILRRGSDIRKDELLVKSGARLDPTTVGLLAAAGYASLPVFKLPRVAILATGDEVIAPGEPLKTGKLYASNLVTLAAWCSHYHMQVKTEVIRDEPALIRERLAKAAADQDAVLTSGGAWTGDRDLVVHLLEELGWQEIYHRVKIGPGKAVGFGLLRGKPVFCLPGGPPSNYMAFINLALPGLLRLAGYRQPGLPVLETCLGEAVRGQVDWTQFIYGNVVRRGGALCFQPLKMTSRLQMMAQAEGIITIPEGTDLIQAGEKICVRVLSWPDAER